MASSSSTKVRTAVLAIWTLTGWLPQSSRYFPMALMMSQIISLSVSASSMRTSLRQLPNSPNHVTLSTEDPCSGIMRAAAPTWGQHHRRLSVHERPSPRQGRSASATSSNIMKQSISWTKHAEQKWSSFWMTVISPMFPICLSIGLSRVPMSKPRTGSGRTPPGSRRHAFLAATQIIPVQARKWLQTLGFYEERVSDVNLTL